MKTKISYDIFKKKDTKSQFLMLYSAQPIDLGFMMHKLAHDNLPSAKALAQFCTNVPHQREHMIEMQTEYNQICHILPDLIAKNTFVHCRVMKADIPVVCHPLDLISLAK